MIVLEGGSFSCERGTPVNVGVGALGAGGGIQQQNQQGGHPPVGRQDGRLSSIASTLACTTRQSCLPKRVSLDSRVPLTVCH